MDIQPRTTVNRSDPVRPQNRVDRRALDELAARQAQEQNAVDRQRQIETANVRRAQQTAADKGRHVDRYA